MLTHCPVCGNQLDSFGGCRICPDEPSLMFCDLCGNEIAGLPFEFVDTGDEGQDMHFELCENCFNDLLTEKRAENGD